MLLFLFACSGSADDSKPVDSGEADADTDTDTDDSGTGPLTDADHDGFYAEKDDCDDTNPRINPDAQERCDGLDNNCDGSIDGSDSANRKSCYPDDDRDGWADDSERAVARCSCKDDESERLGDCDDAAADAYPGAVEADCASDRDLNCDGFLPSEDADGDGVAGCEDCNDADDAVYPGAAGSCNDCNPETELADATLSADFALESATFTHSGDSALSDGQLLLTTTSAGSVGTGFTEFEVPGTAPFAMRFTATLCCDGGSEGLAVAIVKGTYGTDSVGGAGAGLGLAGLQGYGFTLDTHAGEGEPSDGFLGFVSTAHGDQALTLLDAVDGFPWNDGVPREVLVRYEPSGGGAADLTVAVDGVQVFESSISPPDTTLRLGVTGATGETPNSVQAIDDLEIKACL